MALQTPIHGFDLPTIGGDVDIWGDFLNTNWSDLDTLLAIDATATFLPVTGGTMTGQITLVGGGSGFDAVTVDEADAAASVAAGIVQANLDTHEGLTDNPHSVTAAQTLALPLAGGTMTGQIVLPGSGSGLESATVDDVDAVASDLAAHEADVSFSGVRLTRITTPIVVSRGVAKLIEFNNEDYDTDNYHDSGVNPERITIPAGTPDAIYKITAAYLTEQYGPDPSSWSSNIAVNSGGIIAYSFNEFTGLTSSKGVSITTTIELSAGDFLTLEVLYTGTPVTLDISANPLTFFTVERVGFL